MSLAEKIYDEVRELPEQEQEKVIDFIKHLKNKEEKEIDDIVDEFIEENMEALKELAK